MKYLTVLLLLLVSSLSYAGPAIDRAQAVMDGLQGAPVAKTTGLKVLNAFANQFSDQLPMTTVTSQVCDGTPPVCNDVTTTARMAPSDLTNEEKAQVFLDIVKGWTVRAYNADRKQAKRKALKADQDALDAQVDAESVSDL